MKGLKYVHKHLDENVQTFVKYRTFGHKIPDTAFTVRRAKFCKVLKKHGYETRSEGNYIIATKGNECVTFYFTAHSPSNNNYLVSSVLKNEVNYFAFYDNENDKVYIVGYGMVRQYCKSLNTSYMFFNRDRKLFIPDGWAKQQTINTYIL